MAAAALRWRPISATEMTALAARGLPTLVLWSDHDGVIPLSAFDTFCSTFGADGQVVAGGHSWLLARPDVFGQVLDNVVHVQGCNTTNRQPRPASISCGRSCARRPLPDAVTSPSADGRVAVVGARARRPPCSPPTSPSVIRRCNATKSAPSPDRSAVEPAPLDGRGPRSAGSARRHRGGARHRGRFGRVGVGDDLAERGPRPALVDREGERRARPATVGDDRGAAARRRRG